MRKYILLYTGLLLSVSGCSMLELDESTGLDREEAYSYFSNVKGLATYVYSQLPGDLGVLDGALRESATDNSVYVWSDNSINFKGFGKAFLWICYFTASAILA